MIERYTYGSETVAAPEKDRPAVTTFLLLGILLYALVVSILTIDYNSVFIDEAFHITMGKQLLGGEPCDGCPSHTGSVTTWPIMAAYGDSWGGLYGARALTIAIGLMTTLTVCLTARMLLGNRFAILAAAIFQFSGQALYLMKLATYDMLAAFFLSLALLLFVASERVMSGRYEAIALGSSTFFLFLAAVTKYLVPVFVPAFLILALLRRGTRKTILYVVVPLMALSVLYISLAPYPPNEVVASQISGVQETSRLPLSTLTDWTFRWVALAYLLAIFGLFHEKRGKTALMLILLSTPIILLHLVTRTERSVNKNMIFALIFLAPAAALGVDHIAHIFSMRGTSRAAKRFFTIAVVAVFWAYGFYNLQWLEGQYPDVSPVIEYFDQNGFDGMRVAMNGWDGVIYEYSLGSKYPNAEFQHISSYMQVSNPHPRMDPSVDFIVCEDKYYGKHWPCTDYSDSIGKDFILLEDFMIQHSWGITDAQIYGRK
jgi:4-amino-4-deoxy-L-arabinose transferase-like glycosyltransferase